MNTLAYRSEHARFDLSENYEFWDDIWGLQFSLGKVLGFPGPMGKFENKSWEFKKPTNNFC